MARPDRLDFTAHAATTALGLAVIASAGCFHAPRGSEDGIPPRSGSQIVPPCDGNAWVDINNTGNAPVDIYVRYSGSSSQLLLGTVPPGTTRIGLTRTPVNSFTAHDVSKRIVIESTSSPHPGTDRVHYMPGCKESGLDGN